MGLKENMLHPSYQEHMSLKEDILSLENNLYMSKEHMCLKENMLRPRYHEHMSLKEDIMNLENNLNGLRHQRVYIIT